MACTNQRRRRQIPPSTGGIIFQPQGVLESREPGCLALALAKIGWCSGRFLWLTTLANTSAGTTAPSTTDTSPAPARDACSPAGRRFPAARLGDNSVRLAGIDQGIFDAGCSDAIRFTLGGRRSLAGR
ncbi:MAG: hypothetical protein H7A53_05760 [Akkermansiaceae bacterium]|nr:hypothetical protein [Akkermansiaceae bacterium]